MRGRTHTGAWALATGHHSPTAPGECCGWQGHPACRQCLRSPPGAWETGSWPSSAPLTHPTQAHRARSLHVPAATTATPAQAAGVAAGGSWRGRIMTGHRGVLVRLLWPCVLWENGDRLSHRARAAGAPTARWWPCSQGQDPSSLPGVQGPPLSPRSPGAEAGVWGGAPVSQPHAWWAWVGAGPLGSVVPAPEPSPQPGGLRRKAEVFREPETPAPTCPWEGSRQSHPPPMALQGLLPAPPPASTRAAEGCRVTGERSPKRPPQEAPGQPPLLGPWEAGSLGSSFWVSGSWPLPRGLGAPRCWGYQVGA